MKSTLTTHSESCPYYARVGLENPLVGKQNKVKTSKAKRKKQKTEQAIIKPLIEDAEEKFVDFISILIHRMKNDKLMAVSKSIDEIMIEIKNDFDFNFCKFYLQEIMQYVTKIYEVNK